MTEEAATADLSAAPDASAKPDSTSVPTRLGLFGLLPSAKGAHNYFAGEIQDASVIGLESEAIFLLHSLKIPTQIQNQICWAGLRSVHATGLALLVFGSLSVSGADYRNFGIYRWIRSFSKSKDNRNEETVEKWSRNGLVAGAVGGAYWARTFAKQAGVRPLPMYIGLAAISAQAGNLFSFVLPG